MEAGLSWIIPGRILRLELAGAVAAPDLAAARESLQEALTHVESKVDYLIDVQAIIEFPEELLRTLLDKRGLLRNAKTGRVLIIGANDAVRLVFDSAALALRLDLYHFADEESALAFAAGTAPG